MSPDLWPAPAKLNLFLHITGRRDDGYHLLQTAFQFVDLCDYMQFTVNTDGRVDRAVDLPGISAEEDICIKAAKLLQQESGVSLGATIALDKRIPVGGGLGGGSSNAATTLVALNSLWELDYPVDRLAGLGLRLGADVPVFVRGKAAWAEGVGEALEPLEQFPEPWYLIIAPPVHVSTAAVFQAPELTRNCPPITIRHLLAQDCGNVCEPVARTMFPEIARALDWLAAHADARLTGTGACVFGAFETKEQAEKVLGHFNADMPESWRGFVAKGLNRSPLFAKHEGGR